MAIPIAINGKTQRPSVCNAIESILIDEKWFNQHGSELIKALKEKDVKIIGDEKFVRLTPMLHKQQKKIGIPNI